MIFFIELDFTNFWFYFIISRLKILGRRFRASADILVDLESWYTREITLLRSTTEILIKKTKIDEIRMKIRKLSQNFLRLCFKSKNISAQLLPRFHEKWVKSNESHTDQKTHLNKDIQGQDINIFGCIIPIHCICPPTFVKDFIELYRRWDSDKLLILSLKCGANIFPSFCNHKLFEVLYTMK